LIFIHLELFLVRILIPYALVVGVLRFFFGKKYSGNITPCGNLVVVQITSFLHSVRGLEFPLFDVGAGTLLQSQRGVLGLCALWEAGLLALAE
jgi:hypothetical protein